MSVHYLHLRPGDRVIVPKSAANVVKHHGIYAGKDASGQRWFLENNYRTGVRYIASEQFFNGISPSAVSVQHFTGSELQREQAMAFAKSMVGRPYDLLQYNCEHYSNQVQYGTPQSTQVTTGLAVAAGIAFVLFGFLGD